MISTRGPQNFTFFMTYVSRVLPFCPHDFLMAIGFLFYLKNVTNKSVKFTRAMP